MSSAVPSVTLAPLSAPDLPAVRRLAQAIWREAYASIIGRDQIDFMLAARGTDAALGAYVGAADRWFDVLRVAGEPVGYCSCAVSPEDGVLKLEQLYLAASHRGRGLGRLMLEHVEERARALGRRTVVLQVNKRNAPAIAFYRRAGFDLREEAVFDIGEGFVMDDFIMAKSLG